jgi:hypothetical protein
VVPHRSLVAPHPLIVSTYFTGDASPCVTSGPTSGRNLLFFRDARRDCFFGF